MGCDYYIIKLLHIYYTDTDYIKVELERDRQYYDFSYDQDELDFDEKEKEYKKNILIPQMKPISIYANGRFNKSSSEMKYTTVIENALHTTQSISWSNVSKIIKVEERFSR